MCGETFEHIWNDFCEKEKYINIHVVYEHLHFSICIMISSVADSYDSRTYLQHVMCFCEK